MPPFRSFDLHRRAAGLQQRADGLALVAIDPLTKRAAALVGLAARHAQEWLPKIADAAGLMAIESGLQIQEHRLDELESGLPERGTGAD